jgi:hypothetical protein
VNCIGTASSTRYRSRTVSFIFVKPPSTRSVVLSTIKNNCLHLHENKSLTEYTAHQTMGNLLDNRRRCERSPNDVMTSLSSVDIAPPKRSCTFFPQDLSPKQNLSIPVSCRFFIRKTDEIFFIRKTDEISRTLNFIHDGISFDKILPNQVGYYG